MWRWFFCREKRNHRPAWSSPPHPPLCHTPPWCRRCSPATARFTRHSRTHAARVRGLTLEPCRQLRRHGSRLLPWSLGRGAANALANTGLRPIEQADVRLAGPLQPGCQTRPAPVNEFRFDAAKRSQTAFHGRRPMNEYRRPKAAQGGMGITLTSA